MRRHSALSFAGCQCRERSRPRLATGATGALERTRIFSRRRLARGFPARNGPPMSFRKKLLLLFAATVLLCVAVISASVYSTIRRSFEQANQDRANAVAAQFRSEFQRRGLEVARKVESVAASETVQRIALDMNRGVTDFGDYVSEARTLAAQQQLDFLELVDSRGTILSSAQWQAKFGYPETAIPRATIPEATTPAAPAGAFLKREELPNGPTLGLFAVRAGHVGEQPLYVIGGERLD